MRDERPVRPPVSSQTRDVALTDEPSGLRGFDRSLPMALLRAREAVMQGFRASLGEHGVTEQQWRVLRALDHAGEPMSIGDLAHETFLLGPSLSRMVASMAERGLIRRTPHPDDARRAEVTITEVGRTLVSTIAPESEAWYSTIEQHLGDGDLDELHRLLDRLADLTATTATTARLPFDPPEGEGT